MLIKELIKRELSVDERTERVIYGLLSEESYIIDPPFEIALDISSESVQEFLRSLRGRPDIPYWVKVYQAVYNRIQSFRRSFKELLEIGGYPIQHDQKTRRVIPLSKFLICGKGNCLEKGILAQLAFQDIGTESYLIIGSYGSVISPHYHAFNLVDIDGIMTLMDIQNPKGSEIQRLSIQETERRAFLVPVEEVNDDFGLDVILEFEGNPSKRKYWFRKRKSPFLRY